MGALSQSHGVSCESNSGGQAWYQVQRVRSSRHEQIPRWYLRPALFLMRWVVATLGTPASLSGFPASLWANKRQEVAQSHALVSVVGVGPARPLLSARYRQALSLSHRIQTSFMPIF